MSAAQAGAPLLARFVALDIAVQAGGRATGANASALGWLRPAPTEQLRRAAAILALSRPDAGDLGPLPPVGPGEPEALHRRWSAAARALAQRGGWRSPLGSDGRFVAAALGFSVDVRAREHAEALEETLQRLREARVRAPRRALVITAALLVTAGVRQGTGIVPSFARLRELAEARRTGRSLAALACGDDGALAGGAVLGVTPVPADAAALARAQAVLAALAPRPSAACLADLAATFAAVELAHRRDHATLAAGVAVRAI